MEELNAAMELLIADKPLVGYWMNWMGIVMLASVLFAWWKKPARWVFLSFLLIFAVAMGVYTLSGNIHLMGVAHLIIWPFLTYYLLKSVIMEKGFNAKSIYGVWVILVVLTVIISMLFDVRDLILVLMGMK
jgi:hypothetical protein